MKKLITYFFRGLIYIIPTSGTIYVIYFMINKIENIFDYKTYGAGIIIIFITIVIIGFLGDKLISNPLKNRFDKFIKKMPFIKIIYSSIKELISAFIGNKKSFDKPVFVKLYKDSEVQRIGFVTDNQLQGLNTKEEELTVYVPHSFAMSGQLFVVPKNYTKPIENIHPSLLMKYIVSGGITQINNK